MIKLAIIHFQPIEKYPPVLNFLNYLAVRQDKEMEVRVYTMETGITKQDYYSAPGIKIIRSGVLKKQASFFRYCNYVHFYLATTSKLSAWKPDVVLYYETLSALPAFLYKKYFNKACRLLIHYHEYTSLSEYNNGMKIGRWLHGLEKKMYSISSWVSHTNSDRMRFFLEDNNNVSEHTTHIMPNYPPSSWKSVKDESRPWMPVKFVYTGALSLDTMYTREFSEWVMHYKGQIIWDIYSTNITEDARDYLSSLNTPFIQFHGGVNYFSLPEILPHYTIGIILYKGHIPNYVYNAPNKLFEYWACGLDTWFPENMSSSLPYITKDCYPKIIPINFNELKQLDIESVFSHSGLGYKPSPYYCEQIFDNLLKEGIKGNNQ